MLPDGTYDVIVVDASTLPDTADGLRLDVTILDGEHKGQMVSVQSVGLGVGELDALGTPGTLTVADGAPVIVLEP